jgi:DNA-binding response OmpR family regulator
MIVSREQILDNVWDINFDMNTTMMFISIIFEKVDKPLIKIIHTMKVGLRYKSIRWILEKKITFHM